MNKNPTDLVNFLLRGKDPQIREEFVATVSDIMTVPKGAVSIFLDDLVANGVVGECEGAIWMIRDALPGARPTSEIRVAQDEKEKAVPVKTPCKETASAAPAFKEAETPVVPPAQAEGHPAREQDGASPKQPKEATDPLHTCAELSEARRYEKFRVHLYEKMESFAFDPPLQTLEDARATRTLVMQFAKLVYLMCFDKGLSRSTLMKAMSAMTEHSPHHKRFMSFVSDFNFACEVGFY